MKPRIAWLIALALPIVAGVGYSHWLQATTGPVCRPGPDAPSLFGTVAVVVLAAVVGGLAAAGLGHGKRLVAVQTAAVLVLSAALVLLAAFSYVGEHHCFD